MDLQERVFGLVVGLGWIGISILFGGFLGAAWIGAAGGSVIALLLAIPLSLILGPISLVLGYGGLYATCVSLFDWS